MADKAQDEMLREAARARGFRLVKSRRRKPGGDFGKYGLVGLESGRQCLGFGEDGLAATADEVLAYLRGGEKASWKRSLIGVVEGGGKGRAARKGNPARPSRGRPSASAGTSGAGTALPDRDKAAAQAKPKSPPAELAIRPAARRDAAAIGELLGLPAAAIADRIAAAVRADEAPLLAERDGLAGIVAFTIFPTLQHGPRGRVTLLHVAETARRQGLGARLLEAAEGRLVERGVETIEMVLDIDFDAPTAFLRRTGWRRAGNGYGKTLV